MPLVLLVVQSVGNNKAFTKGSELQELEPQTDFLLSKEAKNYITPTGLLRLQREPKHLRAVEHLKVLETPSWPASNVERSENGDYIYGKKVKRIR